MTTFELGRLRHGSRFFEVVKQISCMEPYLSMSFTRAWDLSCKRALSYLDGCADTPLWFWK